MNNYILEYYQGIEDGSIVVGHFLKTWYERVVKGLENKFFFILRNQQKKRFYLSKISAGIVKEILAVSL